MTDPSPQEILAQMVSEAGEDEVGEWRVRVPHPAMALPVSRERATFAVVVEIARQGLRKAGPSRETESLSGLLTAALVRHEEGTCTCLPGPGVGSDPVCLHAMNFAYALAGF